MRKFAMIISGILLILSVLLANEKRAITFDDFFSLKRMHSVAVSPDGKKVAFCLTTPNIEENSFKTDIYLLDLKTGELRRLTTAASSSSHPVWAPDGQTIYFNRSGQIWKISLKGGEARQVTDFVTGASDAVLSKDGRQLLFVSEVYPDYKDFENLKFKVDSVKKSKVKARIIDQLFYRHWNRWLNGKRSHVFLATNEGKVLSDITPGDYDTPPLDLGGQHDYVFSPDGKEICFVRNTDSIVAASTNNDLFLYNMATRKIERLTQNKGNDNNPTYSPDGRYLAYLSMARAGFEADRRRIMLLDRKAKTKKIKELTVGFPYSVNAIFWRNNRELFFTCAEHGTYSIYKVDVKKGKISPVLKGHTVADVQFAGKNRLIFRKQDETMPYELFAFDLKKKKLEQLTFVNKEILEQLELPKLEEFVFIGAKGDSVHGYILRPPFFKKGQTYPAIELIHGGPQGAWEHEFHFRWNYQMFAAPGYVVFAINFHGSSGYGQDFTDAVSKDWGGAPYQDILIGTDWVFKHYPFIDKNRVGAAGASYGGFMINWIAGDKHPFKCLVSHDGVFEQVSMYGATEELWFPEWEFNGKPWDEGSLYQKWNPASPERVRRFHTPMLIVHGEHDYRVPYTQGLQIFTALRRQGIKARLLFFPDEDHFVTKPQNARLWWKTVHQWFAEFLK